MGFCFVSWLRGFEGLGAGGAEEWPAARGHMEGMWRCRPPGRRREHGGSESERPAGPVQLWVCAERPAALAADCVVLGVYQCVLL